MVVTPSPYNSYPSPLGTISNNISFRNTKKCQSIKLQGFYSDIKKHEKRKYKNYPTQ